MIGLITNDDESIYLDQLDWFVHYCDANYLELNISKTKEMVLDFRSKSNTPEPVVLKGSIVERVSSYKYLGVMIDDRLNWHTHVDSLIKRLNSRMYCLRKLNYFNVNSKILSLFYESVIESVWRYCISCWGGNITAGDIARINRIVKGVERMIGESRLDFNSVYEDLLYKKLADVMDDRSHPLHDRLVGQLIPRSGRMRLPPAVTDRYLSSFVPQAVRLHNSNYQRGVNL